MNIENVYYEIYLGIFIIALIFYLINNFTLNKLISIIIIILLSILLYYYLQSLSDKKDDIKLSINKKIDNDVKNRDYIQDEIYYIHKFPKDLKYLKKNKKLVEILYNIRFIRKFNKSCFSNILLKADKLNKIYIFILNDRYNINDYIPIFMELRNDILEILYSLIMIIPEKLKFTYNLDPIKEIEITIDEFRDYSREMLDILEKYGKINKKLYYIPDTYYRPYNSLKGENVLP